MTLSLYLRPEAGTRRPLLIFDFDGTLWDSLELVRQILNELAPTFGFKTISPAKFDELRRSSVLEIIAELGIKPRQVATIAREVRQRVHARRAELRPFAGALAALERLRDLGYPLALLSSNHEGAIRDLLGEAWLAVFVRVQGDTGMWGKSGALTHILGSFGLQGNQALYIGDEVRDVEAAHDAGLDALSVEWGANHAERLFTSSPALMVGTPAELPRVLERHYLHLCDLGLRIDARAAWSACAKAVQKVSTTFATVLSLLPPSSRRPLMLAYLLMRLIDSVEDADEVSPQRRIHQLARLERALQDGFLPQRELPALAGCMNAEDRVLLAIAPTLFRLLDALPSAQRAAIASALVEMTGGVKLMLERGSGALRFGDEAEYAVYVHHVSGVVGEVVTKVLAALHPLDTAVVARLERHAPAFARALKAANDLQDVFVDAASTRGSPIPHSYFAVADARPDQILDPARAGATLRALRGFAATIERDLEDACEYIALIPKSLYRERLFLLWPLIRVRLTLDRVQTEPLPVPEARTRLVPRSVPLLSMSTYGIGLALLSNRALKRLLLRPRPGQNRGSAHA